MSYDAEEAEQAIADGWAAFDAFTSQRYAIKAAEWTARLADGPSGDADEDRYAIAVIGIHAAVAGDPRAERQWQIDQLGKILEAL